MRTRKTAGRVSAPANNRTVVPAISPGRAFKDLAYGELARMGGALSDPRRLEVLDLICQAETSVEQVGRAARLSLATASHHLRALRDSSLATSRKAGRRVYYRATPAGRRMWLALSSIGHDHAAAIREALRDFFRSDEELTQMSAAALVRKARKGEITLIDVRPSAEFAAGHLPGAISMPLEDIGRAMEGLPTSRPIAAYCRGRLCVMSKEAVRVLRSKGYDAFRTGLSPLDWEANQTDDTTRGMKGKRK